MFDGHGGDFVVKFIHKHMQENLLQKLAEAQSFSNDTNISKIDCKNESDYKMNLGVPLEERSNNFLKFYKMAADCLHKQSCHINDDVFKNKIYSMILKIRSKTQRMQKNYNARCYVDSGQIDYVKMIVDELLLIEYHVLMLAQSIVTLKITIHL